MEAGAMAIPVITCMPIYKFISALVYPLAPCFPASCAKKKKRKEKKRKERKKEKH
jgi:hypothetical protein